MSEEEIAAAAAEPEGPPTDGIEATPETEDEQDGER